MLMPIAEGIYKLVLPVKSMGSVNSFLIRGDRGYTVLDTGANNEESIQIWKDTLSQGITIEKVVLTHIHQDHIGLASWFQQDVRVPVFLSRHGYEELNKNHEKLLGYSGDETQLHELFLKHGGPEVSEKRWLQQKNRNYFEPDDLIEDHQEVRMGNQAFTPIWTPGHSPDHICLYDRVNQLMFIGDHVLDVVSPVISISSEDEGNPLSLYFQSLESIAAYPSRLVLPGHGNPIADLNARILEIKSGHWHRLEQILELLIEDGGTVGQLCQSIYGERIKDGFFQLEFMATLTRLLFLNSIGKVTVENRDGKIFFLKL